MARLVLGVASAAVAAAAAPAASVGALPDLAPAAQHEGFTVFHAGAKLGRTKLARLYVTRDQAGVPTRFVFRYRRCRTRHDGSRRCSRRVVIANEDACGRESAARAASGERVMVRGVETELRVDRDRPQLLIHSGGTAISISARSSRGALRAAEELRAANLIVSSNEELPAPWACPGGPPPLTLKAEIGGLPKSDGVRWAASIDAASGATVIYDELRGTVEKVAAPGRCGSIAAVGGGRLAWLCQDENLHVRPLLLNLETKEREEVRRVGGRCAFGGGQDVLLGLGSDWVHYHEIGDHNSAHCYYRRGTGELATDGIEPTRKYDRVWPDLDSESLWQPLCRPLERRDNPTGDPYMTGPAYFSYSFDGRFGAAQGIAPTIELDRCGRRYPVVLSSCPDGCGRPQLGARLITWSEPTQVKAVDLESGRRTSWAAPPGYSFAEPHSGPDVSVVAHTRKFVFAAVDGELGTRMLAVARVPGR